MIPPSPHRSGVGGEVFGFVHGSERKTTGSYYTARELVKETLDAALDPVIAARLKTAAPTQRKASPEQVRQAQIAALLALRVCDSACGSGHFLLAAARRIGRVLAQLATGEDEPAPEAVRHWTREAVIHCIYGVDKNPLAVNLDKVAPWVEGHVRRASRSPFSTRISNAAMRWWAPSTWPCWRRASPTTRSRR